MTIQTQEEQRCSSCFYYENRTAGGERRDIMAKFLSYEDRLEIESSLKAHMTFTEIGRRLGRDRTTITKEVRNYSVEQDTGYSVFPHNTCKYRKGCRRKKYAEQRTVNIRSYPSANSVDPSVTVTVNSMKKRYACTVLNRLMPVTDAVRQKSVH